MAERPVVDASQVAAEAVPDPALLAPHGRRLGAFLIDVAILPLQILWMTFLGKSVLGWEWTTWSLLLLVVVFAVTLAALSGAAAWLTNGQTLGKALVGIRERRIGPRPVPSDPRGLVWSFGRHSAGYVAIDVFGVGSLLALVSPRRRALHDLLFGSEVVYLPPAAETPLSWHDRGRSFTEELKCGLQAQEERHGWIVFVLRWQVKFLLFVANVTLGILGLLKFTGVSQASAAPTTSSISSAPAAATVSTKVGIAIAIPTTVLSVGVVQQVAAPNTGYRNTWVVTTYSEDVRAPDAAEIVIMRADGSEWEQLTDNDVRDSGADLFHDERIVFVSERDGPACLYVMGLDGAAPRRLTESPSEDDDPDWSPDGKRIAFDRRVDDGFQIWVISADGSGEAPLTSGPGSPWEPDWSPDGRRIAFTDNRDGNDEIYVANSDGSDARNLTEDDAPDYSPTWSPDGERIVFVSERDNNQEIYVMRSDGSEQQRLTNESARDWGPFWSPDGKKILFYSGRGVSTAGNELWAMDPDGSDPEQLTQYNSSE